MFCFPMGLKSHDSPRHSSRPLPENQSATGLAIQKIPEQTATSFVMSLNSLTILKKGVQLHWIYCIPLQKNVEEKMYLNGVLAQTKPRILWKEDVVNATDDSQLCGSWLRRGGIREPVECI